MQINVIEYLEKAAAQHHDKIGFEDKNTSATFAQFRQKALNVSTRIVEKSNAVCRPIAVFLPKSVNALISFCGILYSGNIYVPLDIKNPQERLKNILCNIAPALIITDAANAPKLENIFDDSRILIFDELAADVNEHQTNWQQLIDCDGAYIINTSGSTGTPKGVLISHRSIIDYIEWACECYKISSEEIIANQAPFYFDNSVLDIYLTLKNGCKLVICDESLFIFPIKLLEFFKAKNVSLIFFVPSILVNIANMDLLKSCKPNLKKILFAGEVMPTKQLNYWIRHYPNTLFSNLYGPTEITVDCTYYTVDRTFEDNEPLPIGKRCRNSGVFLLDGQDKEITQPNVAGELCVRGTSLALGYYNDREKTDKVFTVNPLNKHYSERIYRTGDMAYYNDRGEIIFQGRKDLQIKHMGYRVELGEIETALGAVKELKNICVIYSSKKSKLVLFYESDEEIKAKDLILKLSKSVPKYMIPTETYKMDKLPLNNNGKIDRVALKNMVEGGE